MAPISFAAGSFGAMRLLATPTRLFDAVISWLLPLAALTFAIGARTGIALRRIIRIRAGAVGLMMVASGGLLTADDDLKSMAPACVLLVSAANGGAVVWFIAAGAVRWPETLAMLGASVAGGYLGARLTRITPPHIVRRFVIVLTACVTAGFFLRII